jgi:diguanylate cyclase (GGDEF)-like protein/PAS domain S-box-containing protein
MSLGAEAATTAVAVVSAATVVSLWRGAERHSGSVRHAYWLFALAGLLCGLGAIGQQLLASASAGGTFPLTIADLPGLVALPTIVAGLASLGSRREAARHPLAQHRGRVGTAVAHLADGYVLASSLFIIYWITSLRAGFARSGDDPGTFAVELIHPLADLLVLGGVLPLAVAAGRRGAAPFAALFAVSVSDVLAVGVRVNGYPSGASQAALIAGLILLASTPWIGRGWRAGPGDSGLFTPARPHATTILAALAATAAALAVIGWTLAGHPATQPVLAVAGATTLLALTARIVILVHRDSFRSRLWHESGQQFRELAERTSDVVLVCDYGGRISYASPAVRHYGYTPEGLEGQLLADLVHPEDRLGGMRAVRQAAGASVRQIRYSCRVRAADGTWRYVEATISRHRSQGAPDRLLVTSRDVSDMVALRRQIAHLTYHDGLTGLPNRAYLEDRSRDALSLGRLAAVAEGAGGRSAALGDDALPGPGGQPGLAGVILVDLDGFTGVNDVAGPSAGDLVLAQVARRLRAVVPPRETVARWGGDEFAVLVTAAASAQEITDLAERIVASVAAEPFRAADRAVSLTVSVGVALADGSPAAYVWRNADAAVSRAKELGGGRLEVDSALPYGDLRRRLGLAAQLSSSLSEGQLELEFRPIADLDTALVTGAQALPRWQLAGAEVPRSEFLAVAETSRVIVELGDWMLREACAQAAAWRQGGWEASIWLACSARQVMTPRFTESVLGALAVTGLPPDVLILEVGQPVLVEAGEVMMRGLGELRERGARLAMAADAAGLGTLARLSQLPVDLIRVGPDLVAGLGVDAAAETLIRAVVRLGVDLGIEVVADGVDRAEQRDLLAAMGCRAGMGGLLAGPVPPDGVPNLADDGRPANGQPANGRPGNGVISPAETNALSS